MIYRYLSSLILVLVITFIPISKSLAVSGDADGNGVVDVDDARFIALYLTHQISSLPNPADANATQDDKVDMEDAFIIAKKATGQTRFVVVAPAFGSPEITRVGQALRIQVFEKFFPFNITAGTVRIRSLSTGYDSGDKPLTFEKDGRSLYYHWDTAGLKAVTDYQITVNLIKNSSESIISPSAKAAKSIEAPASATPDAVVSLSNNQFEPYKLAANTDAVAPVPGIPLVFSRINANDSNSFIYDGALGKGWIHNYDIHLTEFTDGKVSIFNGYNRDFVALGGGIYKSESGDYGTLTRDTDGSFQLKERNGLVYVFYPNLKLNFIRDTNGNQINAFYNQSGKLIKVSHSSGAEFNFEYNLFGHITKLTDHVGRITKYEYQELSNCPILIADLVYQGIPPCSPKSLLTKVTDPSGAITQYSYVSNASNELANYRLQSIQFPDGTFTHYQINDQGQITKSTGTWGANPVNYDYSNGNLTTITDNTGGKTQVLVNDRKQPTLVSAADGGTIENIYDNAANLIQKTDPLGHVNQFSYDEFGNLISSQNGLGQTSKASYDLRFNKPSTIIDPIGHATTYAYDTAGNLAKTVFADNTSENYSYDAQGNLLSFQNAGGKITSYSYNNRGQVINRQDALNHATQFKYNNSTGDLQTVTDANGHAVSNQRDILGRLLQRTYPDGSQESYSYDAAGKPVKLTNRRGQSVVFSYDNTGKLAWKTYTSGKKRHYFYDNAGYLERVELVDGQTVVLEAAYEFDPVHRVNKVKVAGTKAPNTYDMTYRYDLAGNRTQAFYPDGYALNYSYDAANRLIGIAEQNGTAIVNYEYDAAGRRTKRILGNGTYTLYAYNNLNQLIEVANYSPSDNLQSRFVYEYNATGLRIKMTTLQGQHNYSYDDINQLTQVQYPDGKTVKYDFDAVGNRKQVTKDGAATTYETNNLDQYTQVGNQTLSYDANGNLATQVDGTQAITYAWDEDDRLISVDKGSQHIEFDYDYNGNLIGKSVAGTDTRYVWDGIHIALELDNSGNTLRRFVYGANVDEILLVTAGNSKYWAQQDGLGSVIAATNDNGNVISSISYDVYGNVRGGNLSVMPQRFAGMWWDNEVDQYYVRARWMNPRMGIFISPDPKSNFMVFEKYTYAKNAPTVYVDPSGYFVVAGFFVIPAAYAEGSIILSGLVLAFETRILPMIATRSNIVYQNGYFNASDILKSVGIHASPSEIASFALGDEGSATYNFLTDNLPVLYKSIYDSNNYIANLIYNVIESGVISISAFAFQSQHSVASWAIGNNDAPIYGSSPSGNGWQWFQTSGSGGGGWLYTGGGGGLCPTFVQGGQQQSPKTEAKAQSNLIAQIKTPWVNSLLRSDIPIFGTAKGENFARYRVEYGKGAKPDNWQTLYESDKPQESTANFNDLSWMQGDIDIKGNLTTWNTGFNEWVHLPWHAPEDTIDLNGLYTIRLTVTGKDGKQIEDSVTGEVGRAIAQSLPGYATSPDHRVALRFPEQALSYGFRVYTILPTTEVGEDTPSACEGCELLSPVYRIREPGDRFIKDVSLEFSLKPEELAGRKPEQIGIARYDVEQKQWIWLDSRFNKAGTLFSTSLTELAKTKALYALLSKKGETHAQIAPPPAAPPAMLKPIREGVLIENHFEHDFGTFKSRDHFVGAELSRDKSVTKDGSYALKFTNTNFGGNFSSTVLNQPFDAREYNVLSFDYRIKPGVKIDFYLKVNGRWYRLIFTGEPIDLRNRDVNIANLGWFEGVIADDKWHTAGVDLSYFLSQQTRHTQVDEIMMGDWRVEGYRKLEFGNNQSGATYYIDNFNISSKGKRQKAPAVLLVDSFNEVRNKNELGNMTGIYATPGTNFFQVGSIDIPNTNGKEKSRNRALNLAYEFMQEGAYGGYWTSLAEVDLSQYSTLAFRLYAPGELPPLKIGIRGKQAQSSEGKASLIQYASAADSTGWREVHIPLTAFRGIWQFTTPDVLFISGAYQEGRGKGNVWIDDVRFEQTVNTKVSDFESPENWTALGGDITINENGAAALSARRMPDPDKKGNSILRISYGGSIGKDYGSNAGGFSFASWEAGLNGTDVRPFKYLTLRIRGEKGGETPNFYLNDAATRYAMRTKELEPLTREWKTIRLPLAFYTEHGIDLSHIESLQIVFEWNEQQGTIYVDDIGFE